MKTKVMSYSYDIERQILNIYADGENVGSLEGPVAENKFNQLMQQGVKLSFSYMNQTEYKSKLIRRFHAALGASGLMKRKEDILASYGVESTTELSIDQLKQLVELYSTGKTTVVSAANDDPAVRAMRSELLTICNKMGIYVTNDDWGRVNSFFSSPRVAGKTLNKLSYEELVALRPKLRAMLAKYDKKQIEIDWLTRNN